MRIEKFEDLEIWQKSLELLKKVYNLTLYKDFSRDFALRDQIRRAAISINSNIAEGFDRNNNNEFVRFLKIAKGSAGEVRSQLRIAHELCYIDKKGFQELNSELNNLIDQIGRFTKYLENNKKLRNLISNK